jgi:hypothetical protein
VQDHLQLHALYILKKEDLCGPGPVVAGCIFLLDFTEIIRKSLHFLSTPLSYPQIQHYLKTFPHLHLSPPNALRTSFLPLKANVGATNNSSVIYTNIIKFNSQSRMKTSKQKCILFSLKEVTGCFHEAREVPRKVLWKYKRLFTNYSRSQMNIQDHRLASYVSCVTSALASKQKPNRCKCL